MGLFPTLEEVILPTLSFTAANDSLSFERALIGSDDSALAFPASAVMIDDDPIIGLAELVSAGRIGK